MNRLSLILFSVCALFVRGLREQFCTANVEGAAGSHGGAITKRAAGAFPRTHLLVKKGIDVFHGDICGASDYPIGITDDQPENAEDVFFVRPLGSTPGSVKVAVGSAIADSLPLYTAANGLAQGEPAVAGTYYKVGHSIATAEEGSDGNYTIEMEPIMPVKLIVVAALTSAQNATTNATDLTTSEALANALKVSYNALQTDVAALATAMASPALVKHL
jgi:hypothetical protein